MDFNLTRLRKEAKLWRKINSVVSLRLIALCELSKRLNRRGRQLPTGGDFEWTGARVSKSGKTIQRWFKAYIKKGSIGLDPKAKSGRPRMNKVRGHSAKKILKMRKRYNWGAEVIHEHLKRDSNIFISRHQIHTFLKRKGLLKKIRVKKKSKHTTKVVVKVPGTHTQIDVKYLTRAMKSGERAFVYTFIDHASKWRFKKGFRMFGNKQTKEFMDEVIKAVPFKITRLQTDNGSEFTNRFLSHLDDPKKHILDIVCEENEIRHKLIPPGEKELQGLVERNHRQDDEELYHRIEKEVNSIEELNQILSEHTAWCNSSRRRKALNWETSDQWLSNYKKQAQEDPGATETENVHYWKIAA